jgi:hypothetical protein
MTYYLTNEEIFDELLTLAFISLVILYINFINVIHSIINNIYIYEIHNTNKTLI